MRSVARWMLPSGLLLRAQHLDFVGDWPERERDRRDAPALIRLHTVRMLDLIQMMRVQDLIHTNGLQLRPVREDSAEQDGDGVED